MEYLVDNSSQINDLLNEILLKNESFSKHKKLIVQLFIDFKDSPTKDNLAKALKNNKKKHSGKFAAELKEEQNVISIS